MIYLNICVALQLFSNNPFSIDQHYRVNELSLYMLINKNNDNKSRYVFLEIVVFFGKERYFCKWNSNASIL